MQITTQFNVGQEVWLMHNNRPVSAEIFSIRLNVSSVIAKGYVREEYSLTGKNVPGDWAGNRYEVATCLFESKAQLLASLA